MQLNVLYMCSLEDFQHRRETRQKFLRCSWKAFRLSVLRILPCPLLISREVVTVKITPLSRQCWLEGGAAAKSGFHSELSSVSWAPDLPHPGTHLAGLHPVTRQRGQWICLIWQKEVFPAFCCLFLFLPALSVHPGQQILPLAPFFILKTL